MTISSQLDEAVARLAPRAVELLESLVAQPSTVGQEQGAQEVLAAALSSAGFEVTRLAIPNEIANDPAAGVPRASYEGRYDVIGQRGPTTAARTMLLNGHIDVVPADDRSGWSSDPFDPVERDGWLFARGAGDMKAGFAAGLLALWALDECEPAWMTGGLTFVSAIEEEYTGNGTLAAGRAGYLAQAALLLEPTDLDILLAGIAIVWITIDIKGLAAHAEAAQGSVNPIDAGVKVIDALHGFESEMNREHSGESGDSAFFDVEHPYNVNVGTFVGGDWASSVPGSARIEVRVGHPAHWSSAEVLERVHGVVADSLSREPWFDEHPPRVELTGFRAERYAQDADAPFVHALAAAHRDAHGYEPGRFALGSTTDARFYVNQFGIPAAAYGPRARNIHGSDESVELASIIDCARTVARLLHTWYATEAP